MRRIIRNHLNLLFIISNNSIIWIHFHLSDGDNWRCNGEMSISHLQVSGIGMPLASRRFWRCIFFKKIFSCTSWLINHLSFDFEQYRSKDYSRRGEGLFRIMTILRFHRPLIDQFNFKYNLTTDDRHIPVIQENKNYRCFWKLIQKTKINCSIEYIM